MSIGLRAALAAASCLAFGHALAEQPLPPIPPAAAQTPVPPTESPAATSATDAATPALAPQASATEAGNPEAAAPHTACCLVPAGSPVLLEILDPLTSASAVRGDTFRFRLAEPVRLGGAIVIPAGVEGRGEIIHAQRAGSGGKAGELLLAARHLDHADSPVALRAMKLGGGGTNRTTTSLAVALVTGPFGLLVKGGNIEIPVGTLAQAKLANAFMVGEAATAPPATTSPSTTPGDAPHTADASATTATQQE